MVNRDIEDEKVSLIVCGPILEEIADIDRRMVKSLRGITNGSFPEHNAERYAKEARERSVIIGTLARQLTAAFPEWGEPDEHGKSSQAFRRVLEEVRKHTDGTSRT